MISELRIQNLVLVSQAILPLGKGFNVITGETGAGKSAVLAALSLVLGGRSDLQLIRKGEVRACAEISLELAAGHPLFAKLEEWGIPIGSEGEVVIRRELKKQGKSRAFVNDFSVQLTTLKEIGSLLVNFVGQHASFELLTLEKQRLYLDLFADRSTLYYRFKEKWEALKGCIRHLEELRGAEAKRIREMEMLKQQREEIDAAAIVEGEEEHLFAKYSAMSVNEGNQATLQSLSHLFSELLNSFYQAKRLCTSLKGTFDFIETVNSLEKEVGELSYTIERNLCSREVNPIEMQKVNERLTLIHRLNKKYGDPLIYREKIEKELQELSEADETIESLVKEIALLESIVDLLAKELSGLRQRAAKEMALKLKKGLQSLNMPKVELEIKLFNQIRNSSGDETIEFFITPNAGEEQVAVKSCASGGELARLMLVLQELLSAKDEILVFDEIDANIGGQTANAVGKKLRDIGEQCQVICITHFPQVASLAHRHIQIEKREEEERTMTIISELYGENREKELLRMQGK